MLPTDETASNSTRASPKGVAALVIHYGDPELTRVCLESLSGFDEIVVVDHPPVQMGELGPGITRVAPGENLGFAGGCNAGVSAIRSPYVFVINNDATLAPDALAKIENRIEAWPSDVAAYCPTIIDSRDGRVQSSGGLIFSSDVIGVPRNQGKFSLEDAQVPSELAAPSGAAFLFSTESWNRVGGMAAEFFCYCEDGDIGLRWQAAGLRVLAAPEVLVTHAYSTGTSVYSLHKAYLVERNHILTAVHSAPLGYLLTLPVRILLRLAAMAAEALSGKGAAGAMSQETGAAALVTTVLKAWRDAVGMLPQAIKTRRQTLQQAPVGAGARRVGEILRAHRATRSELLARRD